MKAKVTPLRPEGRSAKIVATNNRRSGHSNTTLSSSHTTTMKNSNFKDDRTEQNELYNTTNPTIRSATLQTNAPTDNNTGSFTWQVTRLCPVPLFHPLETSAIRLTDVSLEHLTARISEYMRLHSVQCYYHADRVDCVSSKLVKFVVQLWQGGENDSTFILEIQRRQGCSIAMQQIRQSFVHYVQTGEALAPTASSRCRRFPPSMRHRLRSKNHHDVIRDDASARAAKTLCMYLLESSRLDQKYLGLESLKAATDTRVTFPRVAEQVSMALLVGKNDCDARLRHPFLQYFRNAGQSGPTAASTSDHDEDMYSDCYDDYETTGYAKSRCFGAAAHVLALSALSNALESLVWQKQRATGLGSGNNPNYSKHWSLDVHSEFWITICGALEYNLVMATSRPHEAALSAKCIRLLSQLGTTTVFPVDRFLPLLFHACEHGRTYHSHLEQECRDLIQCLVASAASISGLA